MNNPHWAIKLAGIALLSLALPTASSDDSVAAGCEQHISNLESLGAYTDDIKLWQLEQCVKAYRNAMPEGSSTEAERGGVVTRDVLRQRTERNLETLKGSEGLARKVKEVIEHYLTEVKDVLAMIGGQRDGSPQ